MSGGQRVRPGPDAHTSYKEGKLHVADDITISGYRAVTWFLIIESASDGQTLVDLEATD